MSTENSITWQKLAIIIAVLTIVLPALAKFYLNIVFPENYLLYEASHTTKTDKIQTASIIVSNAGRGTQKEVFLYLPSDATEYKNTSIEVSTPKRSGLRNIFEAEPSIPLEKFSKETGAKIPLGNIEPEEEVPITLTSISKSEDPYLKRLTLSDARVESASMLAIEADGIRYPRFNDDLHSTYISMAPFMLAMLLAILGIAILAGMIFDLFFDSPQKKMTRLWRQMDQLQEKIDKERRYQ